MTMTTIVEGNILPIMITLDGRVGLTLWAPPWTNPIDGEAWQGLLGVDDTVKLFPTASALRTFLDADERNELSDHPGWAALIRRNVSELRATPEYSFDLDGMPEVVAGDPTPEAIAEATKLLYLVSAIADCCAHQGLARLLETDPGFVSFTAGRLPADAFALEKAWDELGVSVLRHWGVITTFIRRNVTWEGSFAQIDADDVRTPVPFIAPWQTPTTTYIPASERVPANPGTSGLAIIAFILALLGVGLLAVMFGVGARDNIKRTGKSGDGLAIAALVLGWLEIGVSVVVIVVLARSQPGG